MGNKIFYSNNNNKPIDVHEVVHQCRKSFCDGYEKLI